MCRHETDAGGIGLEAVAEALVGEVDEGHQSPIQHQVGDRLPFVGLQVGAGGVVAAPMEENDISRLRLLQVVHHRLEVDGACFRVEIPVWTCLDADLRENCQVVGPGRRAGPDRPPAFGASHQIEEQAQRTAAARGLRRAQPA